MSAYHNTLDDLGLPAAWDRDYLPGPTVAVKDGLEYDRQTLAQFPMETKVTTMVEEGTLRGIDYYQPPEAKDMPQDPSILDGLDCNWYPEELEEAFGEGFHCPNHPVAMGNGVSGPGFVAFCSEHLAKDRWSFAWWYPIVVTIRQLDDLLINGELQAGRQR